MFDVHKILMGLRLGWAKGILTWIIDLSSILATAGGVWTLAGVIFEKWWQVELTFFLRSFSEAVEVPDDVDDFFGLILIFWVDNNFFDGVFFEGEEEMSKEYEEGTNKGEYVILDKGDFGGDNDKVAKKDGDFHDFEYTHKCGHRLLKVTESNTVLFNLE